MKTTNTAEAREGGKKGRQTDRERQSKNKEVETGRERLKVSKTEKRGKRRICVLKVEAGSYLSVIDIPTEVCHHTHFLLVPQRHFATS